MYCSDEYSNSSRMTFVAEYKNSEINHLSLSRFFNQKRSIAHNV